MTDARDYAPPLTFLRSGIFQIDAPHHAAEIASTVVDIFIPNVRDHR